MDFLLLLHASPLPHHLLAPAELTESQIRTGTAAGLPCMEAELLSRTEECRRADGLGQAAGEGAEQFPGHP